MFRIIDFEFIIKKSNKKIFITNEYLISIICLVRNKTTREKKINEI